MLLKILNDVVGLISSYMIQMPKQLRSSDQMNVVCYRVASFSQIYYKTFINNTIRNAILGFFKVKIFAFEKMPCKGCFSALPETQNENSGKLLSQFKDQING